MKLSRNAFYQFYKEVADIYEIISPDKFLRPYLDDYDTLTRMYRVVKEAYEPGALIDKELMRKTARLVQEYSRAPAIESTLEIYGIDKIHCEGLRKAPHLI
ncbi:MAG: hypothetical protein ACUVQM_06670 [Candidatus Hadarchaeaceae archaeon]